MTAVWLRVEDIAYQSAIHDELHALRAIASRDAAYIATHNHLSGAVVDYSIPMALWDLLLLRTVGLEEWGLRLPVLMAGIALVVSSSWFVWRAVGRFEGTVVAWCLATAPLLIFYSRFARPYMVVGLLTFLALAGWIRWRRTGGWLPGMVAAGGGAFALFFNLSSAPAVLCIWGSGLIHALPRGGRSVADGGAKATWTRWAVLVLIGCLITLVLVGPSLSAHLDFVSDIGGHDGPTLSTWWSSAGIMLGTDSDIALGWLLAMTIGGGAIAFRRSPAVASVVVMMLISQALMVLVVKPSGARYPSVIARYMMAAVPATLVLTCLGLCATAQWIGQKLESPLVATRGAVILMLAVSFATGGLPRRYAAAHVDTGNMFDLGRIDLRLDPERIPRFYHLLAEETEDVTVVEWPWFPEWKYYQDFHRKGVVGIAQGVFREEGFRFRSMVEASEVLSGRADHDYVILHKDPENEWSSVRATGETADPASPIAAASRVVYAASLTMCRSSPSLREVHEDEWLTVFARVDGLGGSGPPGRSPQPSPPVRPQGR